MKSFRRKYISITLMFVICLLSSGISVFAARSTAHISGGYTSPSKIEAGDSFILKGKIVSNTKIKRVEIGVVNRNTNKWTSQKYDNSGVNAMSFNLVRADKYIKFGKLKEGSYMYRIYAHTYDKKVHIVLNKPFTVVKKASTKSNKSTKSTLATSSSSKDSTKKVSLSGHNTPPNYNVGRKINVRGTMTYSKRMSRIEIGIVFAPTNKWTEYKYDRRIFAKSFDISRAASTLKFEKLPGGAYYYRAYAHTPDGVKLVINKRFVVKPSKKPHLAVVWARKIANDNSFTYGKKPETSSSGCYFCKTNHRLKPKGFEKTYVCLTFLGAAYAHGAKDPEILKKCQKGKLTMYSNNSNFTKFSCWMKLGKCKELNISDLQIGDIIVDWSDDCSGDGHVWMYAGGDTYVDSEGFGWSADSIAVRKGANSYYKYCKKDNRNYVMRYRY